MPDAIDAPDEPHSADLRDETSVVVTTTAAAPPVQVWETIVGRTSEWWTDPYLAPGSGAMHLEPVLGGQVWSSADGGRDLHGTIRAFDPPRRLEVGGVLVPGAYAGTITITVERTSLGSEIHVEHTARGRIDDAAEERMTIGWTTLTSTLADLAES